MSCSTVSEGPGPEEWPDGLQLVRITPEFDEHTVPAGLLAAHRIASGVWGRLLVRSGSIRFVFEEHPDRPVVVAAGDRQVIPPAIPHHVELIGPVRFVVEFHRPAVDLDADSSVP